MPPRSVPPSAPGSNGLKRHPALVPLSRDHHEALVQARALRLAASGSAAEQRKHPAADTARAFLAYFEQQLRGHIQDEERTVLPPAEALQVEGVERVRAEHREIEALVSTLRERLRDGRELAPVMQDAGQLLDDHVRYEERAFFEAVQTTLSPEQLASLGKALEEAREARGGPSCAVHLSAGPPDLEPIR